MFALMDVMIKAFKSRTRVAWHFDGHLFIVKSLDGSKQLSGVAITSASFWTRAYDLPIMCQTETTLISIAKRVGDLEVFEPLEGLILRSYLIFKVAIDITKPLLKGLKNEIKGEEKWMHIKYESLPFYCFCCGMVGYNFKACDIYDRNECPDPVDLEYGPFLKASPMKKG
ncbi:hypothetical protein ACS0TY_030634 [Phlomoides rotata]